MIDHIRAAFLESQREEGLALAAASDVLTLVPGDAEPPDRWLAELRCTSLVRTPAGEIVPSDRSLVGIWFPDDYLRAVEPFLVLQWLGPRNVFHPNVSDRAPFICAGRIRPGTPLVDLLYRVHEIVTFARVTMVESDALNPAACVWARANVHRFPLDARPLRRSAALQLETP